MNEDIMTKLHMTKKTSSKIKIIDKHEDKDTISFTVRTGDTPIFDRKYKLYKKEWEAYFEAQRQLGNIK